MPPHKYLRSIMNHEGKNQDKDAQKPDPTAKRRSAGGRITGWRLWLFRIIAVTVIPALLLVVVEACLRGLGLGYPGSPIIKCRVDGRAAYHENYKFGWRFFPKNISRGIWPFLFPADKSPQTYRIFVLGGSAARGIPDPAYAFSRILKAQLKNRYPGVKFEVVNLAMTATNSHVVLAGARGAATHQPDLFIIYLGNNEVVGPYGAGTVFAPLAPSLSTIRAGIALKSTRIGQLTEKLLGSFASDRAIDLTWKGMGFFLEKQVPFDSPALKHVYSHFERNLIDTCEVGRKAGAKVILCTVGTNLKDCAPFGSQHRSDISEAEKAKWDDFYHQAISLQSAGRYDEAIKQYGLAVEIDEQFAVLYFRMGRAFEAMGDYAKAKESYIKARELDTLRFRADMTINKIIRSVGRDKAGRGIYFVDTLSALENASPHGILGHELLYEHAHFNFTGNYIIAATIFEQIEKIFPEHLTKTNPDSAQTPPLLTEQACAERLAYTDWDRGRVADYVLDIFIKKPPFTDQLNYDEQVRQLSGQIKALNKYTQPDAMQDIANIYQEAVKQDPSDWVLHDKFGKFLKSGLKDPDAAAEQYRIVTRQLPHFYANLDLGTLLYRHGKFSEATEYFEKCLQMRPASALVHFRLAMAFHGKRRLQDAIKHYSRAIKINPMLSADLYNVLAVALSDIGKPDKAIQTLYNAVELYPDDMLLRWTLGFTLTREGKTDEAISQLQAGLKIDPDHADSKKLLEDLNKRKGASKDR